MSLEIFLIFGSFFFKKEVHCSLSEIRILTEIIRQSFKMRR